MGAALAFGQILAPLIGGAMGESMSQGDRDTADQARQFALQEIMAANPKLRGQYEAQQVGPTGLSSINVDPRLREAQLVALQRLQQEGLSGGMSAQDRAMQAEALNRSNAMAAGRAGALRQEMAARGMGGSGAELAARLANNQAAAQQANEAGMNAAGLAQQRALQSIMQAGAFGQQMEGQQYGEAANAAQAQDAINRFNAQQRANAQAGNFGLQQQNFQNTIQRAGAEEGMSGAFQNSANSTAGLYAGLGQGTGEALGSLYRYQNRGGQNGGG